MPREPLKRLLERKLSEKDIEKAREGHYPDARLNIRREFFLGHDGCLVYRLTDHDIGGDVCWERRMEYTPDGYLKRKVIGRYCGDDEAWVETATVYEPPGRLFGKRI